MSPRPKSTPSEEAVREIRRRTRRKFSSEEKIRIVLEGLRGEMSIAELCRQEEIHPNQYYNWSKEFLEAGKKRIQGDTTRQAGSDEVKELRRENADLKQELAEHMLKIRYLKKAASIRGSTRTNDASHSLGEDGDHSAGGAVRTGGEADLAAAGYPAQYVLPLI